MPSFRKAFDHGRQEPWWPDGYPVQHPLLLRLTHIGSDAGTDGRTHLAEHRDRPVNMVLTLQNVQQFLLRLLRGQAADTLGQGRRGIVPDDAQTHFQRSKAALAVIACFL